MASTSNLPTAPAPAKLSVGQITDEILHDLLIAGAFAAKIFVKNPQHQTQAGNLISAVSDLMQYIDPQLTGQASTLPAVPANQ